MFLVSCDTKFHKCKQSNANTLERISPLVTTSSLTSSMELLPYGIQGLVVLSKSQLNGFCLIDILNVKSFFSGESFFPEFPEFPTITRHQDFQMEFRILVSQDYNKFNRS